MNALLLVAMIAVTAAGPLWAEAPPISPVEAPAVTPEIARLSEVMQMAGVIEVMRTEGLEYGAALRDEMFPEQGGPGWDAQVGRIYEPGRMLHEFEAQLGLELAAEPAVAGEAMAFFDAPLGRKILTLELEARRTLLDDAAEEVARAVFAEMEAKGAPRVEALRRFAQTNDLIEMNVMGALNADFAFYRGLNDGGAFSGAMSEADMLAEVWGREADIRSETEDWLWPYLSLAYQPLSDEELQAYQVFSESPAGRKLNAAVFAAFDAQFGRISNDLGHAVARAILGEDI
ncbi:MAG: DUF2059 domain-containing protein [Gemmobacter sp.]|jgi:hypothetical protein|nr:DUF2059 domain-containing protein [Gemmobacter sp.]